MEGFPAEIYLNIFCRLDYQNLATARQGVLYCNKVCKKWKILGSDNTLWSKLFKERWGDDSAAFYAPDDSRTWKTVYEVQDRCDRVGLGLKIIREGADYYLIHQGEIQRYLGSKRQTKGVDSCPMDSEGNVMQNGFLEEGEFCQGILDRILFFIGDLEVASMDAKRSRIL